MQKPARPLAIGGSVVLASGLVAITPIAAKPVLPRSSDAAVRLTSGSALTDFEALLSGILGGTPVTSLNTLTSDLTTINDATGLNSFLGAFEPGLNNLASELTSFGNLLDPSGLAGIQNIPYNLFADIVNIPYYESLAVQEQAFALGPGGSTGGVPGWIPPGATVANGGVDPATDQYALGGTGSYLYESVGNTWGWDDGNWPQVDGLVHFVLPFQFTEPITEQAQGFFQAESIDGASVNCEFQCASFTDYLDRWFHVPLSQLEAGYTYPTVLEDTVGGTSATGVVNAGGTAGENVIWSGQTFTLNPNIVMDSITQNLTSSPANDPIHFTDPVSSLLNSELLSYDVNYDFNFFTEGSFVFWGASSLYTIPDLIGGELQDLTGIPNQFLLPNLGAEPLSGYTDTFSSLLPNLEQGFQYLIKGLEGYLNPATYLGAASAADVSTLPTTGTDLASMVGPQLGADLSAVLPQLASLIP